MPLNATEALDRWQHRPDCLIEMLHDIQAEYNYLPREIVETISSDLKVPVAKVLEVASFYNAFGFKPKGRFRIGICMGTACYVKGGPLLLDRFQRELGIKIGETTGDGLFSLEAPACVGTCGQAPVIMLNSEEIIGLMTIDGVTRILGQLRNKAEKERHNYSGVN